MKGPSLSCNIAHNHSSCSFMPRSNFLSAQLHMGKSIKMSPMETKKAIQIMNRLSKYPCAKIFLEPVDPNIFPGYYDLIIEPVDISMINQRLKSNDYRVCSEWKHDMKQISINAGTFWGHGSAQEALASRLYLRFEKEYEILIRTLSISKWVRTSFFLAYKVHFLSQKMPDEMTSISAAVMNLCFGSCKSPLQEFMVEQPLPDITACLEEEPPDKPEPKPQKIVIETKKADHSLRVPSKTGVAGGAGADKKQEKSPVRKKSPIRKPVVRRYDIPKYTETEVEGLLCALALLPDADDVREVARIVIRSQPELRLKMPNPKIDINSLTTHTLKQLMDFAKRRFRELRLEFPTQSIVL